MQTILGANGIIGEELAKELNANYTKEIRLVGRNPQQINAQDECFKADLTKADEVVAALKDTTIAYLTVGLEYDSKAWLRGWPLIMKNVIAACKVNDCKLVYFDNTYAYSQDASVQNEDSPFKPGGKKGEAKKIAAELLLAEMRAGTIEALICRAPEFYGPGKTKGFTNKLVFEYLKAGKSVKVFMSDKVLRTLIFAPDASRATALIGNTPSAFGQTWHLPCDDNRLTYAAFIGEVSRQLGREIKYDVLTKTILKVAALGNKNLRETKELFPRYEIDNIFESNKFKAKFPDFKVTTYQEGIALVLDDYGIA